MTDGRRFPNRGLRPKLIADCGLRIADFQNLRVLGKNQTAVIHSEVPPVPPSGASGAKTTFLPFLLLPTPYSLFPCPCPTTYDLGP